MTESTQHWYTHPAVNIVSLTLAAGGVLLAIFFYLQSRSYREPYFYLEPERTVLVNRELAIGEKLTVSYAGFANPNGDITAFQCYFWNAGTSPIHAQDVLQPIQVVLQPGTHVLDAGVLRQSRSDIVQFRVSPDLAPDGKPTNTASLSFKIVEKGDGAALQIVYAGGPKAAVHFTGTMEGATIRQMEKAFMDSPSTGTLTRRIFGYSVSGIMILSIVLAFFLPYVRALHATGPGTPLKSTLVTTLNWLAKPSVLALELCCFLAFIVTYFLVELPHPALPSNLLGP